MVDRINHSNKNSNDDKGGGGIASAWRLPLNVKPAEQVTDGLRGVA